ARAPPTWRRTPGTTAPSRRGRTGSPTRSTPRRAPSRDSATPPTPPTPTPATRGWPTSGSGRCPGKRAGAPPTKPQPGGGGPARALPRSPAPGAPLPPLTESNLSATVFALEALHAAGAGAEDGAFRKALVFVRRCQNCAEDPQEREADYDDGGFFFIYD